MNEREKEIIKTVANALPHMSEMDKGYFLGFAEAMASQKDIADRIATPDPRDVTVDFGKPEKH